MKLSVLCIVGEKVKFNIQASFRNYYNKCRQTKLNLP